MSQYVPDTNIVCENCYKFFVTYTIIHTVIDADSNDDITKDAYTGIINRVKCPYCNTEFTYESPFFVHSYMDKFFIASGFLNSYMDVASFKTAAQISKMSLCKFRRTSFIMDSAEKVRIFKSNLDDGKIEILKLKSFPDYYNMQLDDEYIVFDKSDDDYIYFSNRDFTDKVLKEYKVLKSEYSLIKDTNIPVGDWVTIDREWAKKFMEDNK